MPFWHPRRARLVDLISVMWLAFNVADPPPSTRTPVRVNREQKSVSGRGPVIVKWRIVTSSEPLTRTMSPGSVITSGALMIACSGCCEKSVRPSWAAPVMLTCSS